MFELDRRRLPIDSLGTGIHQVVLMAATFTIINNKIICIEEPETYLHPELQKKLINYISLNTNNQYFITTHSNAIFDCFDTNIYHCWMKNGQSYINLASKTDDKKTILDDLGYKASDILQSNCIVWVEGPSDRIYINGWIRERSPELREGVEYSVMFYGGRLLSHLSVNDDDIRDFINLSRMNQNVAIIIDSDKRNQQSSLNQTPKRIINEFSCKGGFCWVTKGREIENYISEELLQQELQQLYGTNITLNPWGQYQDVTVYEKNSVKKSIDKIELARNVMKRPLNYNILDLNKQISELINFIKKANSIGE